MTTTMTASECIVLLVDETGAVSPMTQVEKSLRDDLKVYGKSNSDFRFNFQALQTADAGIVPRELEPDGDGSAWGQHGHATKFYAVLIRSKQSVPPKPRTFAQLKEQSKS